MSKHLKCLGKKVHDLLALVWSSFGCAQHKILAHSRHARWWQ